MWRWVLELATIIANSGLRSGCGVQVCCGRREYSGKRGDKRSEGTTTEVRPRASSERAMPLLSSLSRLPELPYFESPCESRPDEPCAHCFRCWVVQWMFIYGLLCQACLLACTPSVFTRGTHGEALACARRGYGSPHGAAADFGSEGSPSSAARASTAWPGHRVIECRSAAYLSQAFRLGLSIMALAMQALDTTITQCLVY